ncbi:MAG: DUF7594 domain-containing protein [Gemmatimonadales bacterium]
MRSFARTPRLALLAGTLLIAGSCGENLGPDETLTLGSTATLDGFTYAGAASGGNAAGSGPLLGDYDNVFPGREYRQFYSFDLSALPGDAEIQSATLRLYQASVQGNPYVELGVVVVDHVDYGVVLDATDHGIAALASAIGTLSASSTEEYKTLVVTSAVRADQTADRTRSQFRVRFVDDGNNDGTADFASFSDAEDSCCTSGFLPELVIVYKRPQ